ncbi:WW domain-containing oxidoreductase-like [Sycon ciliatum]|uniref:WW domain-containing oxidoreductase-like n=1 Tax=Sycon ciliatum TaxID=27933 RepID=UPI0031F6B9C0
MDEDIIEDELSDGELDDTELPDGWDEGITDDGKVFYVCHLTRETQWSHPKTNRMRVLSKTLPQGWVKMEDGSFYDEVRKAGSTVDPRLLRAPKEADYIGFRERVTDDGSTVRMLKSTFKPTDTADDVLSGVKLDGKVAIVTGANSGLGYEVARSLAQHGTHVIMACRCLHKGHVARKRIIDEMPGCFVDVMEVDLASFQSIRLFVEDFKHKKLALHMLVCNAAVMGLAYQQTIDGIEAHFAVNYLSNFLLVKLLLPLMLESAPCRVVLVTSEAHWYPYLSSDTPPASVEALHPSAQDYWPTCAYNSSKLCLLLFMQELSTRHGSQGVFCNAVHPGNLLSTALGRHSLLLRLLQAMSWPFGRSPAQGAAVIAYCAAALDLEHVGGYYFVEHRIGSPSKLAKDQQLSSDLWEFSERLVAGLKSTSRK